jgi:prevent-host-death family protein
VSFRTDERLEALFARAGKRSASEVKSHWRAIVAEAEARGEVLVTSHDRPVAVVLSVERYAQLKGTALTADPLEKLRVEFDGELARLRQPEAADKLRAIFASSPEEMARAANAAADRDG